MPAPSGKPFAPYPLRFKEIFRRTLWGGGELKKVLGKKCSARTGESWEISARPGNISLVSNGPYKGRKLTDLIAVWPREVLGEDQSMRFVGRFPLLVKFLAMHERMSLQVHPSDEFAQRYEAEGVGKMETWYVLSAPKTGRVIRGVLPGTTVTEFKDQLSRGNVEQCLNVMEVKAGDVIFIPPGTVHTGYGGVVVLEVQQSSDHTYRLTDWGRKDSNGRPRPLDVEKALTVTDFYSMGVSKYKPSRILGYSYRRMLLIKCEKFTMEAIQLGKGRIKEKTDRARFQIFTIVAGRGRFLYGAGKKESLAWKKGETYLIPAALGEYDVAVGGSSEIVVTYVE